MLPPVARLRHSADFRRVVRRGRRAGSRTMVVHALAGEAGQAGGTARIGFVVSKAVGNAVVRNRVKRRLRHAALAELGGLGTLLVVVRANPPAATAGFACLSTDLERCLSRVKDGAR